MKRMELAAGAALTAAFLAGGCTVAGGSPEGPSHSATPTISAEVAPGTADAYNALPNGPCDPALVTPSYPEGAKRCIDAYRYGAIAMVTYDMPLSEARTVATQTQETLTHASDGIITTKVEVVEAAPAAKAALKTEMAKAKKRCIEAQDRPTYASTIADETMRSQLSKYDYVIALSSVPPCNTKEGGVADNQKFREADVYTGSYISSGQTALAAAHELLHDETLGHDGFGLYANSMTMDLEPDASSKPNLNLNTTVQGMVDNEYMARGPSPMSDDNDALSITITPTTAQLNPIQLDALRWPYGIVGKGDLPRARAVGAGAVTLSCNQVQAGEFATVSLSEPLVFGTQSDPTNANGSHKFNEVAVVPDTYTDNEGCEFNSGFLTYLVDTSTNTDVTLGEATFEQGQEPIWKFSASGKTVTVNMTGKNAVITAK